MPPARSAALPAAGRPRLTSARSNSCEVVARWRTVSSSAALLRRPGSARPNPSPLRRAAAAARPSHHKPNASHDCRGDDPKTRCGQRVVPKNGIGMAFWIAGVPGSADIVKVEVPKATVAGINRLGICRRAEQTACAIGAKHKERDEQADAAIGDQRASQHDSQYRSAAAPASRIMKSAIAATEPLSSISLPNRAPSRNIGKNCAIKRDALSIKVCVQ